MEQTTIAQVIQPISILLRASNPGMTSPFSPSAVALPPGSIVRWTKNDTVLHTITSFSNLFDSGILVQTQS